MAAKAEKESSVLNTGLVRLHVNLNQPTATALKNVAMSKHLTLTEAIRKAIGTWAWLNSQIERGARLQIVEPDGSVKEVVLGID